MCGENKGCFIMFVKVILFFASTTKIFLKKSYTSGFIYFSFYLRDTTFVTLKYGLHLRTMSAFISQPKVIYLFTFERVLGEQHKVK